MPFSQANDISKGDLIMKFRLLPLLALALAAAPILPAMSVPIAEPSAAGQVLRARPALVDHASTAAPESGLRARVALAEPRGDGAVSRSTGNRLRRLVR
jgi:hypothetical protein